MKNSKKKRKKVLDYIGHFLIDHNNKNSIKDISPNDLQIYIKQHPINEWL